MSPIKSKTVVGSNLTPKKSNASQVGENQMKIENVVTNVPLTEIGMDDIMNSRKRFQVASDGEDVKAHTLQGLQESIARDGQITPVLVEPLDPTTGKRRLIAGYRRVTAMAALYKDAIECKAPKEEVAKYATIRAQEVRAADRLQLLTLNLTENLARKDLTTYEVAAACAQMQKTGDEKGKELSAEKISTLLGLSRQYVQHLLTNIEKLHPKIKKAWEDCHALCTIGNLNVWRALPHEEQWEKFIAANGGSEPEDAGDSESGEAAAKAEKAPKEGISRPGLNTLQDAIAAVKGNKEIDASMRKGMLAALEFAAGEKTKLGNFFDPVKAAEERKKYKSREKAQAALDKLNAKKAELESQIGV